MGIKKENALALVIDFQEKIIPAMYEKERTMEHTRNFVEGLRILKVPMIVTQQYTKGLGNTDADILSAVGTSEFIEKMTFSCYANEEVRQKLLQYGDRKDILICGIETHICVLQTAIALKEAGYRPVLVTDCMSSRRSNDHHQAIERAMQMGITVSTYESLLFELLESAANPEFKEISALVK